MVRPRITMSILFSGRYKFYVIKMTFRVKIKIIYLENVI